MFDNVLIQEVILTNQIKDIQCLKKCCSVDFEVFFKLHLQDDFYFINNYCDRNI